MTKLFYDGFGKREITRMLVDEFPGINYECVRSRVRRFIKKNKSNPAQTTSYQIESNEDSNDHKIPMTREVEYKADGTAVFDRIIYLQSTEELTPTNILKAHGLDPNRWSLISCKNNYYQQQKSGGDILTLYQSKITAKPAEVQISFEDVEKHFNNLKNTYKPRESYKLSGNENYMYEVNIADLHLGKLSWSGETGDAFNSKIARDRFFSVIDSECNRLKSIAGKVEKILFVWTNDFFNSDGISKATTGGTPQDTDLQWQHLFLLGCEMLVEAIEELSKYAPVETFYIASNHSRQVDFYALNYLNAWFRERSDVTIHINCSPRYYVKYGVNLIGFAHSYYEKKQNLPHLMSIERPSDWATTSYREYHLAHYHSEKVEEVGGVIFRWLPSVTGADSWHTECGYIGAVRRSYSFVYDKNRGLIQINSTVID